LETNTNKKLRVAIIGCGWFARVAHAPSLLKMEKAGLVSVVALCSNTNESMDKVAKVFGRNINKYTSFEDLLENENVDVVDLVLPIPLMSNAIKLAFKKLVKVISEKPAAISFYEALELKNTLFKNPNSTWFVSENWRFKEITIAIDKLIKNGAVGNIQTIEFRRMCHVGESKDANWRSNPTFQGGHLYDAGVHFIALLRKLFGEVESVQAIATNKLSHLKPLDTVSSLIKFNTGLSASFNLSFATREESDNKNAELKIIGSHGAIHANFFKNYLSLNLNEKLINLTYKKDDWVRGGVYESLRYYIENINDKSISEFSVNEALSDISVIEAIFKASDKMSSIKPEPIPIEDIFVNHSTISSYDDFNFYRPKYFFQCLSVLEVQKCIQFASENGLKIRANGARDSWSSYLGSDDVIISTKNLNKIIEINFHSKSVRCQSGVKISDLANALAVQGLTLPSLPENRNVTIGGAISTGSHGSSKRWGSISDFVTSITLATSSCKLITLDESSNPDDFSAAKLGLGMLGVVVEIELNCVDMFYIKKIVLDLAYEDFLKDHASIMNSYEHFWIHWQPSRGRLKIDCTLVSASQKSGYVKYVEELKWDSKLLLNYSSAKKISIYIRDQLRLLRKKFSNNNAPSKLIKNIRHASMQYGLPIEKMPQAMNLILNSNFSKIHTDRIFEIKFLKSGSSYLGSNYQYDAALFNLWWRVDSNYSSKIFDEFEQIMLSLSATPHWGKIHTAPTASYLSICFSNWKKFISICDKFDKNKIFRLNFS